MYFLHCVYLFYFLAKAASASVAMNSTAISLLLKGILQQSPLESVSFVRCNNLDWEGIEIK